TPYQVEVFEAVDEVSDFAESRVCTEVRWVRLWHFQDYGVEHRLLFDDFNLRQFLDRQRFHRFFASGPQRVPLVTEVLNPHPGLLGVAHHPRTPVVEYLQPSGTD